MEQITISKAYQETNDSQSNGKSNLSKIAGLTRNEAGININASADAKLIAPYMYETRNTNLRYSAGLVSYVV